MPTYDYKCDACGHKMAVFQSITEDALTECPSCNEPKLRRLIGAGAGIIFKGSGFYETDYKRKRGGSESSPTTEKKSDSGSSDKKKSDTSKPSSD